MIIYRTKEEMLYHPEIGFYTAFGVAAFRETDGQKKLVEYVSDVFLEKEEAENFVVLCNELGLELIHLCDVIEDAIA